MPNRPQRIGFDSLSTFIAIGDCEPAKVSENRFQDLFTQRPPCIYDERWLLRKIR